MFILALILLIGGIAGFAAAIKFCWRILKFLFGAIGIVGLIILAMLL